MARAYLVARTTEVTHVFMAKMGIAPKKGEYWNAPVFNKDARIFTTKVKADEYMRKKNRELHNKGKDGSFKIDISGYSDYIVIPVERGQ